VPAELFSSIRRYVDDRIAEFHLVPSERQQELLEIARYVTASRQAAKPARLTFICTHNSRRSHLSQIWAAIAADFYGIAGVETYSGGTEATAFAKPALAALRRVGFVINSPEAKNPHHVLQYQLMGRSLICFSKVYNETPNPDSGYCAVMTCHHADVNCPVVFGAASRIKVQYEDPKVSDGTPAEAATYDERCRQIAREMLFAFSQVER